MPYKGQEGSTAIMAKNTGKNTPQDAEAPEAQDDAAPAEAQAEAPKEDPVPALVAAIDAALAGAAPDGSVSDELKANLQAAYRKVPAARRGGIQAEIFGSLITREGLNTAALAVILEEMVKTSTKTKGTGTRKAAPALSPAEAATQALVVLQLATQEVINSLESDEVREQARTAAREALATPKADVPEEQTNALLDRVRKTLKSASARAARSGGGGNGEARGAMSDDLAKLIERGDVSEGTVLTHGTGDSQVTATITDGKIAVEGLEGSPFNSPSAAASAVLKSQGKATAVNGWAFWNVQQGDSTVTLGSLRKA